MVWSNFQIIGAIILFVVSLILLGWNYSIFQDRCYEKKIPNRIAFFIYLIPYMMLFVALGGHIFELIIFAPKQLTESIKKCYLIAFPKKEEKEKNGK